MTFETGSRLERIEAQALSWTGLKSIVIPSSVVVLGKKSFDGCKSLKSVTFENGSRLERIGKFAFSNTPVSFRKMSDPLGAYPRKCDYEFQLGCGFFEPITKMNS
jgi:hypothetical protein